jgi:hypothetical protein
LKAQLGCFPLEGVDLALAVARVVKHRASVHKLHPVAEHSIHESGQLSCHSLNRDRSLEPRPQSSELSTQVCIAFAQGAGCHPQGGGQPVVRPQPPFPNNFLAADSVVRTQSQPGNEMILVFPLAHIPARFADHGGRRPDINSVDLGQIRPADAKQGLA